MLTDSIEVCLLRIFRVLNLSSPQQQIVRYFCVVQEERDKIRLLCIDLQTRIHFKNIPMVFVFLYYDFLSHYDHFFL